MTLRASNSRIGKEKQTTSEGRKADTESGGGLGKISLKGLVEMELKVLTLERETLHSVSRLYSPALFSRFPPLSVSAPAYDDDREALCEMLISSCLSNSLYVAPSL